MAFSVRAEKELQKIRPETPPHLVEQIKATAHRLALEDVFGVGYQTDRHGNVVERGIGAPGNPNNSTHFQALEKAEGKASRRRRPRAGREGQEMMFRRFFIAELYAADPSWNWAPLENVLRNIENGTDDFSAGLRGQVAWAIRQVQHPALARLAFIERLFDRAVQ